MGFQEEKYSWSGFPKLCPPHEADPAEGVFFRAVRNIPPTEEDFKRWIDEPHNLGKRRTCGAYSVSLFSSTDSIRKRLFERFPNIWSKARGCGVVEVILKDDVGVMKQGVSDPNHYDLWLQDGITLSRYLGRVVEF